MHVHISCMHEINHSLFAVRLFIIVLRRHCELFFYFSCLRKQKSCVELSHISSLIPKAFAVSAIATKKKNKTKRCRVSKAFFCSNLDQSNTFFLNILSWFRRNSWNKIPNLRKKIQIWISCEKLICIKEFKTHQVICFSWKSSSQGWGERNVKDQIHHHSR